MEKNVRMPLAAMGDRIDVDLSKRPVFVVDRPSRLSAIKSAFTGVLFTAAGLVAHIGDLFTIKGEYDATWAATLLLVIGLLLIFAALLSLCKHQEIEIDDRFVTVKKKDFRGLYQQFMTPISSFIGVRYHTALSQRGRQTRLQHVIELLHERTEKNVPIYLDEDGHDVRRRWERTARTLGIPAVVTTSYGLMKRRISDLNKPLKALVDEGAVTEKHDWDRPVPKKLRFVRKADVRYIMSRSIWGGLDRAHFSLMSIFVPVIFFLIFVIASVLLSTYAPDAAEKLKDINVNASVVLPFLVGALAFFLSLPLVMSVRKYKVRSDADNLDVRISWLFGTIREATFKNDEIESIDVVINEDDGKYYLIVTSPDASIYLGKGLDYQTLEWLRSCFLSLVTGQGDH